MARSFWLSCAQVETDLDPGAKLRASLEQASVGGLTQGSDETTGRDRRRVPVWIASYWIIRRARGWRKKTSTKSPQNQYPRMQVNKSQASQGDLLVSSKA